MRKLLIMTAAVLGLAVPVSPVFALTTSSANAAGGSNTFAVGAGGGKSASANLSTVNANGFAATVNGVGFVGTGIVGGGVADSNANVTQGSTSGETTTGPSAAGAGDLEGGTASAFTFGF
jgi:hypothetical protein